jgi:hypothetical protein
MLQAEATNEKQIKTDFKNFKHGVQKLDNC